MKPPPSTLSLPPFLLTVFLFDYLFAYLIASFSLPLYFPSFLLATRFSSLFACISVFVSSFFYAVISFYSCASSYLYASFSASSSALISISSSAPQLMTPSSLSSPSSPLLHFLLCLHFVLNLLICNCLYHSLPLFLSLSPSPSLSRSLSLSHSPSFLPSSSLSLFPPYSHPLSLHLITYFLSFTFFSFNTFAAYFSVFPSFSISHSPLKLYPPIFDFCFFTGTVKKCLSEFRHVQLTHRTTPAPMPIPHNPHPNFIPVSQVQFIATPSTPLPPPTACDLRNAAQVLI